MKLSPSWSLRTDFGGRASGLVSGTMNMGVESGLDSDGSSVPVFSRMDRFTETVLLDACWVGCGRRGGMGLRPNRTSPPINTGYLMTRFFLASAVRVRGSGGEKPPSRQLILEENLLDPVLPRVARGEPAAVDECLDRYGGLVWSLVRRLAPHDAEDAAQEIFIDLWRNAWRFRPEKGTEITFVSTLARRRLIDRRRRNDRSPTISPLDSQAPLLEKTNTMKSLEDTEDLERIQQCLRGLKERGREAVMLSVYDGLSQSEIAQRLDTPIGTVKTLIRRALIQLRECVRSARVPARDGGITPSTSR